MRARLLAVGLLIVVMAGVLGRPLSPWSGNRWLPAFDYPTEDVSGRRGARPAHRAIVCGRPGYRRVHVLLLRQRRQ